MIEIPGLFKLELKQLLLPIIYIVVGMIIYEILKSLNKKVMLIGSNGIYFNDLHFKTRNTTISALSIKYFIDKYLDNDSYLILELSSNISITS